MRALQPARKVKEVRLDEDTGTATVIVSDYQLSLAIGKEGQNARLAARLTGWRIDIKSETQLSEEEAGTPTEEWAEGEWVQRGGRRDGVVVRRGGGDAISMAEQLGTRAAPRRRRRAPKIPAGDGGAGENREPTPWRVGRRLKAKVRLMLNLRLTLKMRRQRIPAPQQTRTSSSDGRGGSTVGGPARRRGSLSSGARDVADADVRRLP